MTERSSDDEKSTGGRAAPDLSHLLPEGSALGELLETLPPFDVPWNHLAGADGWSVWLGHPPVPETIEIVPAPSELVWGDPATVLGTAVSASLRYALLRGASSFVAAAGILQREGPVSLIIPGDLSPHFAASLAECTALGIPMVIGSESMTSDLALLRQRRIRREAHAVALGRPHDPALSGQHVEVVGSFGGNSLSSFVLHSEGDADGVRVTGTPSERMAVEIGVQGEGLNLGASLLLEDDAARIPGFLDGVSSDRSGNTIAIGWAAGQQPDPETLGKLWQTWLKAIWGATLIDVRLAFAPDHGRSALLVDMRTRSSQYHAYRTETLAPDSSSGD